MEPRTQYYGDTLLLKRIRDFLFRSKTITRCEGVETIDGSVTPPPSFTALNCCSSKMLPVPSIIIHVVFPRHFFLPLSPLPPPPPIIYRKQGPSYIAVHAYLVHHNCLPNTRTCTTAECQLGIVIRYIPVIYTRPPTIEWLC